ncbi:hypothetical protein D3C77_636930 [compost metagenome]
MLINGHLQVAATSEEPAIQQSIYVLYERGLELQASVFVDALLVHDHEIKLDRKLCEIGEDMNTSTSVFLPAPYLT